MGDTLSPGAEVLLFVAAIIVPLTLIIVLADMISVTFFRKSILKI